ncbi:hypothetical protein IYY11_00860 [Methylocystis sp. H62]|uniref:hypothetical protein n=1 Tax=Methylocystis sp. H62 TaxID=2785789 RepID=UPI0018C2C838|nr:hypothetical protein [Methylocystis sp. H62]MBG0791937.1 hypothetical protein [Methylocystis sp. H62]MBG0792047.1 hypothetical protein [Methylocystis sp. H62]
MVPSMSAMGLLRECEERTENSCFALRYTDRRRRLFGIDVVTKADLGTTLNWVGVDHFDTVMRIAMPSSGARTKPASI